MSQNPERHLSPGAVSRDVIAVYRRHWLFLIATAMVILLPQTLVDSLSEGVQIERVHSLLDVATLIAIPLTVVINLFGQALYAGFAAAAVIEWRAGHAVPGLRSLVRVLPIKRLVAVDVILTLGSALGLLLVVIPGLVFLTYYSTAPALIKIEHLGVWESMRRSADLVRGQFWRVLLLIVGTILVTEAVVGAVTAPFHGVLIETVIGLLADGLVQPIEGLVIVVVALALLEIRGEAPNTEELALIPARRG